MALSVSLQLQWYRDMYLHSWLWNMFVSYISYILTILLPKKPLKLHTEWIVLYDNIKQTLQLTSLKMSSPLSLRLSSYHQIDFFAHIVCYQRFRFASEIRNLFMLSFLAFAVCVDSLVNVTSLNWLRLHNLHGNRTVEEQSDERQRLHVDDGTHHLQNLSWVRWLLLICFPKRIIYRGESKMLVFSSKKRISWNCVGRVMDGN